MHTNCFENPNIDLSMPHKNISKVGDRKKVKSSRTQRYSCQASNFSCSILDPWVKPCPSHVTCICAGFQNFCFLWPCFPLKNDCYTSEITILLFSQHPKIQALIHNILPPQLACKMHKTKSEKNKIKNKRQKVNKISNQNYLSCASLWKSILSTRKHLVALKWTVNDRIYQHT